MYDALRPPKVPVHRTSSAAQVRHCPTTERWRAHNVALLVVASALLLSACGAAKMHIPTGMAQIPAGPLQMGSSPEQSQHAVQLCRLETADGTCEDAKYDDEGPVHTVAVDAFYIDKREVTLAQYSQCVTTRACEEPGAWASCNWPQKGRAEHPVNCISWVQARDYCEWVGKRLPTEAEWERAARGDDTRIFPWGDAYPGEFARPAGNFADASGKRANHGWTALVRGYDDGHAGTAPVGSFPGGASPYGVEDLAGNVWEWTEDHYQETYLVASAAALPQTLGFGRVARGGGFSSTMSDARVTARYPAPADGAYNTVGFRCAKSQGE